MTPPFCPGYPAPFDNLVAEAPGGDGLPAHGVSDQMGAHLSPGPPRRYCDRSGYRPGPRCARSRRPDTQPRAVGPSPRCHRGRRARHHRHYHRHPSRPTRGHRQGVNEWPRRSIASVCPSTWPPVKPRSIIFDGLTRFHACFFGKSGFSGPNATPAVVVAPKNTWHPRPSQSGSMSASKMTVCGGSPTCSPRDARPPIEVDGRGVNVPDEEHRDDNHER
jgi:hypothetical protein